MPGPRRSPFDLQHTICEPDDSIQRRLPRALRSGVLHDRVCHFQQCADAEVGLLYPRRGEKSVQRGVQLLRVKASWSTSRESKTEKLQRSPAGSERSWLLTTDRSRRGMPSSGKLACLPGWEVLVRMPRREYGLCARAQARLPILWRGQEIAKPSSLRIASGAWIPRRSCRSAASVHTRGKLARWRGPDLPGVDGRSLALSRGPTGSRETDSSDEARFDV